MKLQDLRRLSLSGNNITISIGAQDLLCFLDEIEKKLQVKHDFVTKRASERAMTAAEFCAGMGGMSRTTFLTWVRKGKVNAFRLGERGKWYVTQSEYERVKHLGKL